MKPREQRETGQEDLFRSRLDQIIDLKHPLVKLRRQMDWPFLEKAYGAVYTDVAGRPPLPTQLMAGLEILKYAYNLSDERLCEAWLENPYFQYFCGEDFSSTHASLQTRCTLALVFIAHRPASCRRRRCQKYACASRCPPLFANVAAQLVVVEEKSLRMIGVSAQAREQPSLVADSWRFLVLVRCWAFCETNPVPFSGGSSKARRKPRAVKRSGTECGLRAAAEISVAFANRAGLAGAPIAKIGRAPRQTGRNRCPVGESAPDLCLAFRAPVQGSAEVAAAR